MLLGLAFAHQNERRSAVGDRARIGRRDGAAVAERGFERWDLFWAPLGRLLIGRDKRLGLSRFHADRRDLPGEIAVRDRAVGALERTYGIGVLFLARELVGFRAILGESPHEPSLVV